MSTSDKYFLTNPYGYPRAGTGKMKKVPNAPATLRRTRAPPPYQGNSDGGSGAGNSGAGNALGTNSDSTPSLPKPQVWGYVDKGFPVFKETNESVAATEAAGGATAFSQRESISAYLKARAVFYYEIWESLEEGPDKKRMRAMYEVYKKLASIAYMDLNNLHYEMDNYARYYAREYGDGWYLPPGFTVSTGATVPSAGNENLPKMTAEQLAALAAQVKENQSPAQVTVPDVTTGGNALSAQDHDDTPQAQASTTPGTAGSSNIVANTAPTAAEVVAAVTAAATAAASGSSNGTSGSGTAGTAAATTAPVTPVVIINPATGALSPYWYGIAAFVGVGMVLTSGEVNIQAAGTALALYCLEKVAT